MLRKLTLLGAIFSCMVAASQNRLEIGMKTGEVYLPTSLVKKDPFLKSKYLLMDNLMKIDLNLVDYYQTNSEYFIVRSIGWDTNQEMRRIEHGAVNVYTFSKMTYTAGGVGMYGAAMGTYSKKDYYYYQKDSDLKSMSISNLQLDLKDNQAALNEILKFKKTRAISYGVWAVGGIMTLVGLNQMVEKANEGGPPYDEPLRPNALFITGIVVSVPPFFFIGNKDKKLLAAVGIYNAGQKSKIRGGS